MQLYVCRQVLNHAEIYSWFNEQGIGNLIESSKYHVTVAYSRADVDPTTMTFSTNQVVVEPNVLSAIDVYDDYAVQLIKGCLTLYERFYYFKSKGCSFDFPQYNPHISISTGMKDIKLTIAPFPGKILLGPEEWEELNTEYDYTGD